MMMSQPAHSHITHTQLEVTSAFGAFLDPVADKVRFRGHTQADFSSPSALKPHITRLSPTQLMVAAALVLLASRPPAALASIGPTSAVLLTFPSVAIISREITMSAFREWAAAAGEAARSAVAVNSLGKWKTAAQMVALALLLAADCAATSPVLLGCSRAAVAATGAALLWLSAALAWVSLGAYMQAALPALMRK